MKNVLCITAAPNSYSLKRIAEECKKKGLNYIALDVDHLKIDFVNNKLSIPLLENVDLANTYVIPRNVYGGDFSRLSLFQMLLNYLHENGAKILNYKSLTQKPLLADKLLQQVIFSSNGFPSIPTHFYSNRLLAHEELKDKLPVLAKPRSGSCGTGIQMISSANSLFKFVNNNQVDEFLFQTFIENDFDIRVITTPDNVIGAMKRARKEGIVNNFSKGANVSKYELSDKMIEVSKQLCKELEADYLGLDLLVDKTNDRFYILEINRFCHFQGFESSTGINLAEILLNLTISLND